MTGTGRAIVRTPVMAHRDPTILPQTPTGLSKRKNEIFSNVFFSSIVSLVVTPDPIGPGVSYEIIQIAFSHTKILKHKNKISLRLV